MLEILLLTISSIISTAQPQEEQHARQIYSAFGGKDNVLVEKLKEKEMHDRFGHNYGVYQTQEKRIFYQEAKDLNLPILLHEYGHNLAQHQEVNCQDWEILEEATAFMFAKLGLRFLREQEGFENKAKITEVFYDIYTETISISGDKEHSEGVKLYYRIKRTFGTNLKGLEKGFNHLLNMRKLDE